MIVYDKSEIKSEAISILTGNYFRLSFAVFIYQIILYSLWIIPLSFIYYFIITFLDFDYIYILMPFIIILYYIGPATIFKVALSNYFLSFIKDDDVTIKDLLQSFAMKPKVVAIHALSIFMAHFYQQLKMLGFKYYQANIYNLIYYIRAENPEMSSEESIKQCESYMIYTKEFNGLLIELIIIGILLVVAFFTIIPFIAQFDILAVIISIIIIILILNTFMLYYNILLALFYDCIRNKPINSDKETPNNISIEYNVIKTKAVSAVFKPNSIKPKEKKVIPANTEPLQNIYFTKENIDFSTSENNAKNETKELPH